MHEVCSERSTGLFKMLDELGVSLANGKVVGLEPAVVAEMQRRYPSVAAARDAALVAYLTTHETLFRTYLRQSDRTYRTAYQILWYMDEIIVRDPLYTFLAEADPAEKITVAVRRNLELIFAWRPYIEAGYLLLGGDGVIRQLPDDAVATAAALAADVHIGRELAAAARYGMVRRPDSGGREWTIYEVLLDTGFNIGFSHPELPSGQSESPGYVFGERLPQVEAAQVMAATNSSNEDLENLRRRMYPREIAAILHGVRVAAFLQAAVLFDREADGVVVSRAAETTLDKKLQGATVGVLDLSLPYLEGATAQQLLDLRRELPEAFSRVPCAIGRDRFSRIERRS